MNPNRLRDLIPNNQRVETDPAGRPREKAGRLCKYNKEGGVALFVCSEVSVNYHSAVVSAEDRAFI